MDDIDVYMYPTDPLLRREEYKIKIQNYGLFENGFKPGKHVSFGLPYGMHYLSNPCNEIELSQPRYSVDLIILDDIQNMVVTLPETPKDGEAKTTVYCNRSPTGKKGN